MKFIIVSALFALFLQVESRSYPYHLVLSADIFDLHWAYNASTDTFYFKVVATTNGWAALALTLTKGSEDMINYDIALGAVYSNSSQNFIGDYWSPKIMKPTHDSQQDFKLLSAMKSNGKVTLEFSRKADTGDKSGHDIKITNSSVVYLAWARSDQNPTNVTDFMKHPDKANKGRGHTKIGYNMLTGKEVEDVTPTKASPTSGNTASNLMPSLPLLAVILLLGLKMI